MTSTTMVTATCTITGMITFRRVSGATRPMRFGRSQTARTGGDRGDHDQGVHGSAIKDEVNHHPNKAAQAAHDQEMVAARVKQIKKQLAEARRNVAKQRTRLALKEETVVQLERELAEAEQSAQPV